MNFCDECGSVMKKTAATTGKILFVCNCQLTKEGGPDDTLMAEQVMKAAEATHDVFIDQAAFDLAANIVLLECPQCGIDYMTTFQVGESLTTMYTCTCGYHASHSDYTKLIGKGSKK